MGERAERLARQFEEAHNELIAAVQGFSDQQWTAMCTNEGRPVNVMAHHIAEGYRFSIGLVQAMASGQPLPAISMEQLDQLNAQHAQQNASCTRQEALDLLRQRGAQVLSTLRGLSDEQLDQSGTVFGRQMTAEQLAHMLAIGHLQGHRQSIRQAVTA